MKLKQDYEDFIAKNLKEFYGLHYCEHCLEVQTTNEVCCGHKHFIKFREFDRETQRKIVSTEFDRYA
jgi:hypothetical protein